MINDTGNPRREAQNATFLQELRQANPAGAELLDRNAAKANIARALRALRKARGLTQAEISEASGLTQPMISKLEAPVGSIPQLDSVMRYVTACNGHLNLDFRLEEMAGVQQDAGRHCTASLV